MDKETPQTANGDQSIAPTLADQATEASCKMLMDGLRARQPRFDVIKKNEDMQAGVNTPALKGRSNIPFDAVVMGGYTDTLLANIDEDIAVQYLPKREQDKMAADKMTAAWEREAAEENASWNQKVQDAKFLAALSGRGFLKPTFESLPHFSSDMLVCDHYDMVTEPQGGADLDKHLFKFQMNIFRTKGELNNAAKAGFYDLTQVRKLILAGADPAAFKKNSDDFNNKASRFAGFGMSVETNNYVGQNLYRLVEGVINYESRWYYILFSYETKIWLRFEPLEEVLEHAKVYPGRGPWVSFATHRHPFIFWSKAPADDIRPIAYTMKKVVNLTIDNLEKRNWDMKIYNPKMFTDPSQFLYRQDGLIKATLKSGESIQNGIFQFQTPDTTLITINLVTWLDNFIGQKTGITPEQQGVSKSDRVGITYANIEQASKRLRLTNKTIRQAIVDAAVIFDYGIYKHLREKYAVKILGPKGAQWEEEITRKDVDCDFSFTVRDRKEEESKSLIASQRKQAGFDRIQSDQTLREALSPSWRLREILNDMGYSEAQIALALDVNNDGDSTIMAKAAQAIADCLEGKELYRMYRDATTGFIQKIVSFCDENFPLIPIAELAKMSAGQKKAYAEDMKKYDKLMAYAAAHIPIAQKNAVRKATSMIATLAAASVVEEKPPAPVV